MTYRGWVKNGVVLLEGPARPPDGSEVSVRVLKRAARGKPAEEIPTLYERLKPIIGAVKDLPPDAGLNHDHYLYGAPKKRG